MQSNKRFKCLKSKIWTKKANIVDVINLVLEGPIGDVSTFLCVLKSPQVGH